MELGRLRTRLRLRLRCARPVALQLAPAVLTYPIRVGAAPFWCVLVALIGLLHAALMSNFAACKTQHQAPTILAELTVVVPLAKPRGEQLVLLPLVVNAHFLALVTVAVAVAVAILGASVTATATAISGPLYKKAPSGVYYHFFLDP